MGLITPSLGTVPNYMAFLLIRLLQLIVRILSVMKYQMKGFCWVYMPLLERIIFSMEIIIEERLNLKVLMIYKNLLYMCLKLHFIMTFIPIGLLSVILLRSIHSIMKHMLIFIPVGRFNAKIPMRIY